MAYVQQSWRDRPGAVAAVVAIHAVIGYALVTGLGYSKIIEVVKNPGAIFIPDVPLPPPPPEPVPQPTQKAIDPPMVAPLPKFDVGPQRPPVETTPNVVPTPDVRPYIAPLPIAHARAAARFRCRGREPARQPGKLGDGGRLPHQLDQPRDDRGGAFPARRRRERQGVELHDHRVERAPRARQGDMRAGDHPRPLRPGQGRQRRSGERKLRQRGALGAARIRLPSGRRAARPACAPRCRAASRLPR